MRRWIRRVSYLGPNENKHPRFVPPRWASFPSSLPLSPCLSEKRQDGRPAQIILEFCFFPFFHRHLPQRRGSFDWHLHWPIGCVEGAQPVFLHQSRATSWRRAVGMTGKDRPLSNEREWRDVRTQRSRCSTQDMARTGSSLLKVLCQNVRTFKCVHRFELTICKVTFSAARPWVSCGGHRDV